MPATGIDLVDLVREAIRPALKGLGSPDFKAVKVIPYSVEAEQLLALTAIVESQCGRHLRQSPHSNPGPALGAFQMEPNTHADILGHFLVYNDDISRAAKAAGKVRHHHSHHLTYNLRYAAVMTRIHYFRAPTKLPAEGDAVGMARYWKRFYNTRLGKGDVGKATTLALSMLGSRDDAKALGWR